MEPRERSTKKIWPMNIPLPLSTKFVSKCGWKSWTHTLYTAATLTRVNILVTGTEGSLSYRKYEGFRDRVFTFVAMTNGEIKCTLGLLF